MRHIVLIGCIVCFQAAFAQIQPPSFLRKIFGKTIYDSSYVKSHYDDLHITSVAILRNHEVDIFDRVSRQRLIFKPNTTMTFGMGIDYKFFTLELSRSIAAIAPANANKGKTQSTTLRFGLTGKKFLASALLSVYQGMYLSNARDVIPSWTEGYPQRPDLTSVVLFGSVYYNFNSSRYSTMASLWQLDRQIKSAGSWLTGITLNINAVGADTGIATQQLLPLSTTTIDPSNNITASGTSLIGINVGYGYNLIFSKHFFTSFLFMPGINSQNASFTKIDGSVVNTPSKIGIHGDIRLMAGHNGPYWYYGIHYANYFVQNRITESVQVNLFNSYLRFFIGRRFSFQKK